MPNGKRAGAQQTPGHPIKISNAKKPAPALKPGAPAKLGLAVKAPSKKKGPIQHGVHVLHQTQSHAPHIDNAMANPSRHTFDRVQRLGGNTYQHLSEKLKVHPKVIVQAAQQSGGDFDKFKQLLLSNSRLSGKSALNPKDDKEAKDLSSAWHSMGMKSVRDTVRLLKSVVSGRVKVLDYTSTGKPINASGTLDGYSEEELREIAGVHRDFANRLRDVIHGGGVHGKMPHTLAKYVTDNFISKFEKTADKADKLVVAHLSKAIDDEKDLFEGVVPKEGFSASPKGAPAGYLSPKRLNQLFRPVLARNRLPGPGERGDIVAHHGFDDAAGQDSMWQFVQKKVEHKERSVQDPDDQHVADIRAAARRAIKIHGQDATEDHVADELKAIQTRRQWRSMDKQAARREQKLNDATSTKSPGSVTFKLGDKKVKAERVVHDVGGKRLLASAHVNESTRMGGDPVLTAMADKLLAENKAPEAPSKFSDDPYEVKQTEQHPVYPGKVKQAASVEHAPDVADQDRHFSTIASPVDRVNTEEFPTPHGKYVRRYVSDIGAPVRKVPAGGVASTKGNEAEPSSPNYQYSFHPRVGAVGSKKFGKPVEFKNENEMFAHMANFKKSRRLVLTLQKALSDRAMQRWGAARPATTVTGKEGTAQSVKMTGHQLAAKLRHVQGSRKYMQESQQPDPSAPAPSKRQLAAKANAARRWATTGGGQEGRDSALESARQAADASAAKEKELYEKQFIPTPNRPESEIGRTKTGKAIMSHGTHTGYGKEDVDDAISMHMLLRDQSEAAAKAQPAGSVLQKMHAANADHHKNVVNMFNSKLAAFNERDSRVAAHVAEQERIRQNTTPGVTLLPSSNRLPVAAQMRNVGTIGTSKASGKEVAAQLDKLKFNIGKIPSYLRSAVAPVKRTPAVATKPAQVPTYQPKPVVDSEDVEDAGTVFRRKSLLNNLRKSCRLIVKLRK